MTKKLLCLGECMLELRGDVSTGQLHSGFAGDTYNAAVYAKRWGGEALQVCYVTAVGNDHLSNAMVAQWQAEQLDCSLVQRSNQAIPGVYAIHTDDKGEREFTYWRQHSAATELVALLAGRGAALMSGADTLFFSGISLAILDESSRQALLDTLATLRKEGTRIAFDPNYRQRLWPDREQAAHWFTRAYRVSDIALPGIDDQQQLFGHDNEQDIYRALTDLGVGEQVIKCGERGNYGFCPAGESVHLPFRPVQQRDSTAAGDSFAGTYLASRLAGDSIEQAMSHADAIARIVVQHPGAIMPRERYNSLRPLQS